MSDDRVREKAIELWKAEDPAADAATWDMQPVAFRVPMMALARLALRYSDAEDRLYDMACEKSERD